MQEMESLKNEIRIYHAELEAKNAELANLKKDVEDSYYQIWKARMSGVIYELRQHFFLKQYSQMLLREENLKSEADFLFYQGVTKQTWNVLFQAVSGEAKKMRYWGTNSTGKRQKVFQVSLRNQLFITLFLLRLGCSQKLIADQFKISQAHVSRIFNTWLSLIFSYFCDFVWWPSRESINKHMPEVSELNFLNVVSFSMPPNFLCLCLNTPKHRVRPILTTKITIL
eukprot:Pompholyxophrys_punicea_v1_NODE_629_length_1573_cov_3.821381.p1 type:complete len:226 gc:universal NODE_629_length_1573_cov_3.821381:1163-486(-)